MKQSNRTMTTSDVTKFCGLKKVKQQKVLNIIKRENLGEKLGWMWMLSKAEASKVKALIETEN